MRPGARYCRICSRPLVYQSPSPSHPPSTQPGRFGTSDLLPLTVLAKSRYVILEKVAQGGMGAIYKAQDRRLQNRIVAVKEMSESAIALAEREHILDCFKREAELLARLEHPNLVRVSDLFQEDDRHYMVMEFIDGRTLQKMLEGRSEPFSEDRVLLWAEQLCDLLSYLHNQQPKIVYRDMKPANVMVLGGTDVVKLIDFGIARFFKPGKRRDTIELGTDGYAPPEQYGRSQTDERADVYALGAMLHQLLTLRDPVAVPFQFPAVRSLNSRISRRVDEAIARAVQPAKERRYVSVEAFGTALLGDEPGRTALRGKDRPAGKRQRKPAQGMPGDLVTTPDAIDFGRVSAGDNIPFRLMKVDIPPGEEATLDVGVSWLNVHPRNVDESGDVTVAVYPQCLKLGLRSLGRLAWVVWPARFLVPTEQEFSSDIRIELNGSLLCVPISVVAVPTRRRVVLGWVAAVLVTVGVYLVAGLLLSLILGVLDITIVSF
jgi:serine/threonine protein kinase